MRDYIFWLLLLFFFSHGHYISFVGGVGTATHNNCCASPTAWHYSMIFVTTPAPTVRPPSR
ncbi:MAG: hypothetical protein WCF99_08965, partial [Chloroflexales bacterium]